MAFDTHAAKPGAMTALEIDHRAASASPPARPYVFNGAKCAHATEDDDGFHFSVVWFTQKLRASQVSTTVPRVNAYLNGLAALRSAEDNSLAETMDGVTAPQDMEIVRRRGRLDPARGEAVWELQWRWGQSSRGPSTRHGLVAAHPERGAA